LAYKLDEEVGVVDYIDKVLARAEQHNADDSLTCLKIINDLLRARNGGTDPLQLRWTFYAALCTEMATDQAGGWDTNLVRPNKVLPRCRGPRCGRHWDLG